MKILPRILWPLSLLLISISCSNSSNPYPSSIQGKTISFYFDYVARPYDDELYKKYLIASFKEDGSYIALFKDQVYQRGHYTYHLESDQAVLIITYLSNNMNVTYNMKMVYTSTTEGTWEATQSSDPNMKGPEGGAFRILHP